MGYKKLHIAHTIGTVICLTKTMKNYCKKYYYKKISLN